MHKQEYQQLLPIKLTSTFNLYATFNPKLKIQSTIEYFEMAFEHEYMQNESQRKLKYNQQV